MPVPPDALLEASIAGGIHLWDVSHLLPVGDKKQKYRPVEDIEAVVVHHSGRLGADGFEGLYNSARYMAKSRGFPSAGYTYWAPWKPERDKYGALVLYRCSPDEERDWHSGGVLNDKGVALCLQGNTSSNGLSHNQEELLEAFLPWVKLRHDLEYPKDLLWHSRASERGGRSKKACPGAEAEAWLKSYASRQ